MSVDEERLRATTDARVWAEEFCRQFHGSAVLDGDADPDEQDVVDLGTMLSWFANAIETAKASVGVADAMRQAGWSDDMVGAAMDGRYRAMG